MGQGHGNSKERDCAEDVGVKSLGLKGFRSKKLLSNVLNDYGFVT